MAHPVQAERLACGLGCRAHSGLMWLPAQVNGQCGSERQGAIHQANGPSALECVGPDIGPQRFDLAVAEHALPWRHLAFAVAYGGVESRSVRRPQAPQVERLSARNQALAMAGEAVIVVDLLAFLVLLSLWLAAGPVSASSGRDGRHDHNPVHAAVHASRPVSPIYRSMRESSDGSCRKLGGKPVATAYALRPAFPPDALRQSITADNAGDRRCHLSHCCCDRA